MLLYEKTGQREKALMMSKRILSFPVKIESKATEKMKQEALKLSVDNN